MKRVRESLDLNVLLCEVADLLSDWVRELGCAPNLLITKHRGPDKLVFLTIARLFL